jgi:putative hydroxymethylpyrimidine transport system substrate-binding protein
MTGPGHAHTAPRPMRPAHAGAALLLVLMTALLLAGCGQFKETSATKDVHGTTPVKLVLDYFPNADHAAIYAAQGTGAFQRAGLDVNIQTPPTTTSGLELVEAGKADFAISYEPELLLARAKGASVQAVGALVQAPLTSLISLPKTPIHHAAQLAGKTVGTAGIPYQAAYLKTILTTAGVDPSTVQRRDLGFNLNGPLVSGKVDATLGGFWNYEALELADQHKKPIVKHIETLGVPTYNELIVVASSNTVRFKGQEVRRFMQALTDGAMALQKNPNVGLAPLLKAAPTLNARLQTQSLKVTLPIMFPTGKGLPYGYMDPDAWAKYTTWMVQQGLIPSAAVAQRAKTNEYLAGQALTDDSLDN